MKARFLLVVAALFLTLGMTEARLRAATVTTTKLTVTSSGNAVGSIDGGTVITLTATVQAGGSAVSPGAVNFCDATAPSCSDIHLLGTAQLLDDGQAVLKFVPGAGSHSYKAVFAGTRAFAGSASAAAPLTVTHVGAYPTATAISVTGSIGDYTLAATVGTMGGVAPAGAVSFLDTTNNGAVLQSAVLGPGTQGLSLLNASNPFPGHLARFIATGDFNHDGLQDLAICGDGLTVHLGDGKGHFTVASAIAVTCGPTPIAIADLNRDGNPDLVIVNRASHSVGILLGHGDGTFTAALSPQTDYGPDSITVADFNQDGFPDLATANGTGKSLTVLLGKGNGLFAAGMTMKIGGLPEDITSGDFNGDGIPDLAVANAHNSILTYLGAGDGTFTAEESLYLSSPSSLAVGDFNADGVLDLAVTSFDRLSVYVLTGFGDGKFRKKGQLTTARFPSHVVMGDFNGDGVADLAVASSNNIKAVWVLPGKGDGTFEAALTVTFPVATFFVASGDFNGDGATDLASVGNAGAAILLAESQSASVVATGVAVPAATGVHEVEAHYPGSGNQTGSDSPDVKLRSAQGPAAATLTASTNSLAYGNAVTFTAAITGSGLTPSGRATFLDGATAISVQALNSGGVATLTTSALALGSHAITVLYSGDANYTSVYSNTLTVAVSKATQTIAFPAIPAYKVGMAVALTATASSKLAVSFASMTPAVCTVSGTMATLLAPGTCTIRATQAGNADYFAAPPVSQSFAVTPGTKPAIDFTQGFAQAGSSMRFNGSVDLDGPRLRLTDGGLNEAGSAFYATPVSVDEFTTYFTFRLSNALADGFTFVLQNNSATALGGGGGGLGYAGMAKSVAVKFDLHSDAGERSDSTGLYVRGIQPDVPSIDLTGTGIDLHSGDLMAVFAIYDKKILYLSITDLHTKVKYELRWDVDIPVVVGGSTAYAGFTGATSGTAATQEITTWKYLESLPTP